VPATLLIGQNKSEELFLGGNGCAIRFSIADGTLLNGPVLLHYNLAGIEQVAIKLVVLQRYISLQRRGQMPRSSVTPESKRKRWALIVRALEALALGPRQRAVAMALFGEQRVTQGWDGRSDFLRSQTRRLIAQAERLAAGGYLDALQG
jgi:hypothetical protein